MYLEKSLDDMIPPVLALGFFYKPKIKKVNPMLKAPKNDLGYAEAAIQLSACSQSENMGSISGLSEPLYGQNDHNFGI